MLSIDGDPQTAIGVAVDREIPRDGELASRKDDALPGEGGREHDRIRCRRRVGLRDRFAQAQPAVVEIDHVVGGRHGELNHVHYPKLNSIVLRLLSDASRSVGGPQSAATALRVKVRSPSLRPGGLSPSHFSYNSIEPIDIKE